MRTDPSIVAAAPNADRGAAIAEWLAGLFIAPMSAASVASYRDGLGAGFLDALAGEPGCQSGARRMRAIFAEPGDPAAAADRLSALFTLLFVGAADSRAVPLCERAYMNALGRLFQAPTNARERLSPPPAPTDAAFGELADHLSSELALLARLMRQSADRHDEQALLDDHLLVWAPIFAARCFEADGEGFYAAAGELLTGFLYARRDALRPTARNDSRARSALGAQTGAMRETR